jgi:hypothetical protein
MTRNPKKEKKPYHSPSFEQLHARSAKAELEVKGAPEDENVRKMLSVIDRQLEEKKQRKRESRT